MNILIMVSCFVGIVCRGSCCIQQNRAILESHTLVLTTAALASCYALVLLMVMVVMLIVMLMHFQLAAATCGAIVDLNG